MQLNAEDGGNRKYILVQLDEKIDKKKNQEAYNFVEKLLKERKTDDKTPTIFEITAERLRRAGEKIIKDKKEEIKIIQAKIKKKEGKKKGQGQFIKDEEIKKWQEEIKQIKKVIQNLDIGFKVFHLVDKEKIVYNNETQNLIIENKKKITLDILYNMLMARGETLDSKIEEIEEDILYKINKNYYLIADIEDKEKLKSIRDETIYINAYADISLEDYLNLDAMNKDNITIVY